MRKKYVLLIKGRRFNRIDPHFKIYRSLVKVQNMYNFCMKISMCLLNSDLIDSNQ